MTTIIFDGKKLETSCFSQKTRMSLEALRLIEDEIKRAKMELTALESARDAYIKAIHADCDESGATRNKAETIQN